MPAVTKERFIARINLPDKVVFRAGIVTVPLAQDRPKMSKALACRLIERFVLNYKGKSFEGPHAKDTEIFNEALDHLHKLARKHICTGHVNQVIVNLGAVSIY